MKYLVIDLANTFSRARHSAHRASDLETKVGFALHVTLSSINSAWRDHRADHVVVCLEGRSWRKDFYKPYKANRVVDKAALTPAEVEEDQMFWQALDELRAFFIEKTNVTVLQNSILEADDLIAGFIRTHPNDQHIIISTDTDFYQLLSENVKQYNGVQQELHTIEGVFNYKGKPIVDKKTGEPKIPNPQWALFEKIIRGDTSDNIFSAYPGVRTKGSKNKVGLLEAFADRNAKGFSYTNLMMQRWTDHNGQEHRVLDDFERNRTLIDLNAQPDHIKEIINETIKEGCNQKARPMIGIQFMKFCSKHQLTKISDNAAEYTKFLSAEYRDAS